MKLPIGVIARFALKHIVLPAIGKADASPNVKLTPEQAKKAVVEALHDEATRQVLKRVG